VNSRKGYNRVTLWGFEESQMTPVCPHKSIVVFQFKDPFEVNELYQSTKISCSSGCKAAFFFPKRSKVNQEKIKMKEEKWKRKTKEENKPREDWSRRQEMKKKNISSFRRIDGKVKGSLLYCKPLTSFGPIN